MKTYPAHPAATAMPLMLKPQLEALAADIKHNGLVHPIVLFEKRVIDGRNRQEACRIAGVEPRFVHLEDGDGHLASYVRSVNVVRRHLTKSQLAVIGAKLMPLFKKDALERQRQAGRDTQAKRKGAKLRPQKSEAVSTAAMAARAVAAVAGDRASVSMTKRAAALVKENKTLADAVWKGEATLNQAEKSIRKKAAIEKIKQYSLPDGKFDVIVGDPPWEFDDELNGSMNRGLDYPTMTTDAICALDVGKLAADDCALFLWTTKSHLLDGSATRVCKAWGFEPKTIITWVKSNIGLGWFVRNRCEHIVVATCGRPMFDLSGETELKDDVIIQTGPRLRHSEKPDEAYKRIEAICPARRRLELNARKPRAGWVTSGSDLAKPAANGESVSALPAQANASAPRESPIPNAQSLSSLSGKGSLVAEAKIEDGPTAFDRLLGPGDAKAEAEFEANIVRGAAADPAHAENDDVTPAPDPGSTAPIPDDQLPF